MLKNVLMAAVYFTFFGVPFALVVWTIFQITERKLATALVGLVAGSLLSAAAALMFFAAVYCEHCAGQGVSLRDILVCVFYFTFGVAMFVAMWLTARTSETSTQNQDGAQ
jgi:hypothetical protein